jgi:hypothetical protein
LDENKAATKENTEPTMNENEILTPPFVVALLTQEDHSHKLPPGNWWVTTRPDPSLTATTGEVTKHILDCLHCPTYKVCIQKRFSIKGLSMNNCFDPDVLSWHLIERCNTKHQFLVMLATGIVGLNDSHHEMRDIVLNSEEEALQH